MNSERRDTGFTDKVGRRILEGDVVMFENDYSGDETEPPEPCNDFGVVLHTNGQRGFEVYCSAEHIANAGQRERGTWPLAQAIDEFGELEIISWPKHHDYRQFVKETAL